MLLFHTPESEVRVRATVRNVKTGQRNGLAITSMDQDHRARLSRWLQILSNRRKLPQSRWRPFRFGIPFAPAIGVGRARRGQSPDLLKDELKKNEQRDELVHAPIQELTCLN
jgi:hypothetical protein